MNTGMRILPCAVSELLICCQKKALPNNISIMGSNYSGFYLYQFICVYQESIPTAAAEKVMDLMLEGVEKALGLRKCSLKKPFYSRVQLWYETSYIV